MTQKRRILQIFGRMNHGGAEMRTMELMRKTDRSVYQLEFCTLSGLPGLLDTEIRRLGGQVHPTPLDALFIPRFYWLLAARRINVIHSHVYHFSGAILMLAAKAGVPVRIAHFRSTHDGFEPSLSRKAREKVLRRWMDLHATHIAGVGEGALVHGWGQDWAEDPRCVPLHNGLDLTPYRDLDLHERANAALKDELGLAPDRTVIMHVGRAVTPKNHPRMIHLFAAIRRREPTAHLVLVGGPREKLRELVDEHPRGPEVRDHITLMGTRSDVPRLLKSAEMLLFPSIWEGLPGVVLESCAAGTPILATDLPGVREVAEDFGTLIRSLSLDEDDERWAEVASEQIAEHRGLRWERGEIEAAFARSKFDMDRAVRRHEALWRGERP